MVSNSDTGALIEAVNVNSDRVSIDGAVVTVDPANDLPDKTNIEVHVDGAAIRDTGTGTTKDAVLLSEDFEGLNLRDSPLANDTVTIDVNDYVIVMSGTLDVKEAGAYTFGSNSDDGQWLLIDVAQDGIDPDARFDDEVIFDNTTHGNQDRLTVCGIEAAVQNCAGAEDEDAIELDVGEYDFEYWYFERGGGSSGEFFYAKDSQAVFDAAQFALIGDDSKGIGVTEEGITATTYKSASVEIGSLETAEELVNGDIDSADGFPAEEVIPTADVWNSGGLGRYQDNHPLPGFPPPGPGDGLDWTDEGPFGWVRDNSALREDGQPEFRGAVYQDKQFWINQQGNQDRTAFTRGKDTVVVFDPDAFDDFGGIGGEFRAFISTPEIHLDGTIANTMNIAFDSSYRPEGEQIGVLDVSFDGGATFTNLLTLDNDTSGGANSLERANEAVSIDVSNPTSGTAIFRFGMTNAGNNWWWAFDNVVVTADMTGTPFLGFSADNPWNFNTFDGASFDLASTNIDVDEGGGEATVTVRRQGDSGAAASVDYAASRGTAGSQDFTATSGTLEFAAGEEEKSFTVAVAQDETAEIDETINLVLSNPSAGAELGAGAEGIITIIDDDRPIIVFQEGVAITINGEEVGETYSGTTDADPAGAAPDDVRDRTELNPDGEDGGSEVHGLTKFDNLFGDGAGEIPDDAVITKATLTLNITNEGTPLTIHRLLGEFDEAEVTWNDLQLNGNTEPGLQADDKEARKEGGEFNTPAAVVDVDVTEDVQAWHSGEAENFGWGFLPTGTNGVDWDSSEAQSPSGRPKLSVEYVIPEPEPDCANCAVGDFNSDGNINFADFIILSVNFNKSGDDITPEDGDTNGDKTVDFADFITVSTNFNKTVEEVAPAAAAVDAAFADG